MRESLSPVTVLGSSSLACAFSHGATGEESSSDPAAEDVPVCEPLSRVAVRSRRWTASPADRLWSLNMSSEYPVHGVLRLMQRPQTGLVRSHYAINACKQIQQVCTHLDFSSSTLLASFEYCVTTNGHLSKRRERYPCASYVRTQIDLDAHVAAGCVHLQLWYHIAGINLTQISDYGSSGSTLVLGSGKPKTSLGNFWLWCKYWGQVIVT